MLIRNKSGVLGQYIDSPSMSQGRSHAICRRSGVLYRHQPPRTIGAALNSSALHSIIYPSFEMYWPTGGVLLTLVILRIAGHGQSRTAGDSKSMVYICLSSTSRVGPGSWFFRYYCEISQSIIPYLYGPIGAG